jgi:hypothetical protein
MTPRWRWISIVAGATALDLVARFGAPFDLARVMHTEAALFPLTALVLGLLLRSEPSLPRWPRMTKVALVWVFALGGLRPLLWTAHVPLLWANVAALVAALTGLTLSLVRRRRAAPRTSARGAA